MTRSARYAQRRASAHSFFFFSSRRRHTRYWRDWSSDVCSSDLSVGVAYEVGENEPRLGFIYCHYLPIGAVEELLVACEHIIKGTTVSVQNEDGSDRKSVV